MDLEAVIETSKTQLTGALARSGVPHITRQTTELIIKKDRVVGYVLAFSWDATLDVSAVRRLLRIVKQAGGYGAVRSEAAPEGTRATLEVSFSLN